MRRWNGSRRTRAGDQKQLPHAAYALQSWPFTGAESYGALVKAHARNIQTLLRQSQQGHLVVTVRKRRPDATILGRRLRHRLLRLGNAPWQGDAVLGGAREPRKVAALRNQWWPR